MDTSTISTLDTVIIAFSVITTTSYLLSQLPAFRRWLSDNASQVDMAIVVVLLGSLSVVGHRISTVYGWLFTDTKYVGPLVGGLYGGPLVGFGTGIIETLEQVTMMPGHWDSGLLLSSVVGLVTGLLAKRFLARPIRTLACTVVVAFTLLVHFLLLSVSMGWDNAIAALTSSLGPNYLLNMLGAVIVAKIFNNERNEEEHKRILEHLAVTDGLTKLFNHRYFHTHIAKEIATASEGGSQLALILLDIDFFKQFNDSFGHPLGDQLLAAIGDELRGVVRTTDVVARYGGDEFAIILPNMDFEMAQIVARRAQDAIMRLTKGDHPELPEFPIAVSIGIATYPGSAANKDELIRRADEALYTAKHSRNKIELYHSVFDDLKAQLDQSEMSLVNTIKTLLTVINAKDRYTYGHSERVVGYAVTIARQLNLPEEEQKIIRIGAFLHDIGKIEISREILNKETPMTPAEAEVIKQHPIWGTEIIQPVHSLKRVVPAVLHHHERYDGTGYPKGLKGEDIPLSARILAVADSFDAMTKDRPYQKAKSFDEALAELRRCAGTQFDPWVVDGFVRAVAEKRPKDRASLVS